MARQTCSCKVPFSTGRPQSLFFLGTSSLFPSFFFLLPGSLLTSTSLFSLSSFSAALVHSFSPRCLVARALSQLTPCYNRQRPDLTPLSLGWLAAIQHHAHAVPALSSLRASYCRTRARNASAFFLFQSHLIPSLLLVVLLRPRPRLLYYYLTLYLTGRLSFCFPCSFILCCVCRTCSALCSALHTDARLLPTLGVCHSFRNFFYRSLAFRRGALKRHAQPTSIQKAH